MCVRRFLALIFILTLIVVGGAFALYQWGGNVLLKSATPQGHFVAPPPRSGPDYTSSDAWIARPSMANDPSRWYPELYSNGKDRYLGNMPPPIKIAAFYIHPTTYLERNHWNAPIDHPESRNRAELFVRTQASAFRDSAEVWAPRYRQAAYGAFLLKSEDAQKALDLAYSDVAAAFEEFLKQVPQSTPLIVAGHSQGSLHLMRLLGENKARLKGRLVAAYVVGWPISTTADLPELGFPPCSSTEQTGCILAWMSFGEPANPALMFDEWEKTPGLNGKPRERGDILCVNPLTGTPEGHANPIDNPGTLVPSADFSSATLAVGQVGAQCRNGLLTIEGEVPALGPYVLPGNNYHVYDYALFWGGVARDANRRAFAWR